MTPVRLEPAALRSRVKHSTTEPLRSLPTVVFGTSRAVILHNFLTKFCFSNPKVGNGKKFAKVPFYSIQSEKTPPSPINLAISLENN